MAKIKQIETIKGYQGKSDSYKIHLVDGKVGYLDTSASDTIREGDDITYSVTKTGTGKNGPWEQWACKLTTGAALPQQELSEETSRPIANTVYDQMKCDLRVAVIKTLGVVAANGKIEPKEMVEYFNEFYPAVDLSIDVLRK